MVERHHLPRPVFFIICGNCTMKPIDKNSGLVYTDSQSNSLPGGLSKPLYRRPYDLDIGAFLFI